MKTTADAIISVDQLTVKFKTWQLYTHLLEYIRQAKNRIQLVALSRWALTAQNQLWLNTCVKQAITLRGMILESLPLTIVMVNGFVWKSGISMRAFVP